ncbi:hypothetical protein [Rothia aeria]|uniref:hypothetical protein n=1 Tax=Rothia aeria TaxID=172042 RepID=UPI002446B022|nr:hypothetical protein [Rothia aeria]
MFGRKKRKKDYTELTTNLQNISGDLVRLNHTVQNASQVTCKETKKESKNLLENIDKILKIISVYLAIWGALNIFLWASYISSWNLADTAFIIQQEGISGGVSRMFALIVSYAIMILISFASLIILIGLPIITVRWVFKNVQGQLGKKLSLLIYICCGICSFGTCAIICNMVIVCVSIFYMDDSSVDGYFDYWVKGENFAIPFIVVSVMAFVIAMIKFFSWDRYKLESKEEVDLYIKRVFLIYSAIVLAIFPIFVFSSVYSKGYGTDCMYLIIKKDSAEKQKNYIYSSISSGGKRVADKLSEKADGKEHIYTLSSYVYSEDKDYLNVMVFSVREMSDNTPDGTPGNDLLGYKSGVLMSIKKSSIDGRYASHPYCFNGKL